VEHAATGSVVLADEEPSEGTTRMRVRTLDARLPDGRCEAVRARHEVSIVLRRHGGVHDAGVAVQDVQQQRRLLSRRQRHASLRRLCCQLSFTPVR
jgi:hypothetical protein